MYKATQNRSKPSCMGISSDFSEFFEQTFLELKKDFKNFIDVNSVLKRFFFKYSSCQSILTSVISSQLKIISKLCQKMECSYFSIFITARKQTDSLTRWLSVIL